MANMHIKMKIQKILIKQKLSHKYHKISHESSIKMLSVKFLRTLYLR